jgi:hypothetical protein
MLASAEREEFVVKIRVDDGARPTTNRRYLQDMWMDTFDSNCLVCKEAFDPSREPPIRTISLVDAGVSESNPAIQVHNRHLCCIIERQIRYYAVSHAWHEPVALANSSRLSNDEAEVLVYNDPLQILQSAEKNTASGLSYGTTMSACRSGKEKSRSGAFTTAGNFLARPRLSRTHG